MFVLGLSNKPQSKQKPPEDQATSLENRQPCFLVQFGHKESNKI